MTTLYWHDYETFGSDPRCDRPAQFAGLRTDEALNEIGDPLVIYCKPSKDILPQPDACLLTGITPQIADQQGLPEPEFIAKIHKELAQPRTCGVGYNTLRFDDEVTRFTLYRNFYDPYGREWQQGNSRWDLIDLVRMTYALRPEGIIWPRHDDGRPSFRLEDLTAANNIHHDSAHDALSDVKATIKLARLLCDKQPRLYNWFFQLRNKHKAALLLDLINHTPVIHTSRMYPSETGCTTIVMPMIQEQGNGNSILVYDLRHNPAPFIELSVEELAIRLFTPQSALPEEVSRLPVKSVKINKCPALAPQNVLDKSTASRINLNVEVCNQHWQILHKNTAFMQRVAQAYSGMGFETARDVDLALYDNFFSESDRILMTAVRDASPWQLTHNHFNFQDKRLHELLFRYRARNWPDTLSAKELQQWRAICHQHLTEKNCGNSITLIEFTEKIRCLRETHAENAHILQILNAIETWGKELATANNIPWDLFNMKE
ncbi:exodeoxyribonuclease I [Nitrosomonas sp. Is37]|uniref:exodeoxyribonuclease I n=1 Tax=Nitrosomonas sp. Is37 TaxID=3080535 RepID=UPI00294B90F6|nr:exodeoxyribonuclease I [Nitrosomonas sp. Is37]MDV6344471.1 exodeoxyribonuclease I [Nitrosomonas sp. Is37]